MSNPQRMSDKRFRRVMLLESMHNGNPFCAELMTALKAERAVVERVEKLPEAWRENARLAGDAAIVQIVEMFVEAQTLAIDPK